MVAVNATAATNGPTPYGGVGKSNIAFHTIRPRPQTRPADYDFEQKIPLAWWPNEDGKTAKVIGVPLKYFKMHGWLLGPTRSGKSWLIAYLSLWLANKGDSVVVMEPTGDINVDIMLRLAVCDWQRVVFIRPDLMDKWGLYCAINPLEMEFPDMEPETQSEVLAIFSGLSGTDLETTPRMGAILNRAVLTLLEADRNATFYSLYKLLTDAAYRARVLGTENGEGAVNVRNPQLRTWWETVFPNIPQKEWEQQIQPLLNRLDTMMGNDYANNMFSTAISTFAARRLIDSGKIILITLPGAGDAQKGDNPISSALAKLMFLRIANAAMDRVNDIPLRRDRPMTWFFGDEAKSIIGKKSKEILQKIIDQAAKANLAAFFANQYPGQMEKDTENTLTGQTGTSISFAANKQELAEWIARQVLMGKVKGSDVLNLERYSVYMKIEVDGIKQVVSGRTFPLPDETLTPDDLVPEPEAGMYWAAAKAWPCAYQAAAQLLARANKERPGSYAPDLFGDRPSEAEDSRLKAMVELVECWMQAKMISFKGRSFAARDAAYQLYGEGLKQLCAASETEFAAVQLLVEARMKARAMYIWQHPGVVAHYNQSAMHVMYASALFYHKCVLLTRATNARLVAQMSESLPIWSIDDD